MLQMTQYMAHLAKESVHLYPWTWTQLNLENEHETKAPR